MFVEFITLYYILSVLTYVVPQTTTNYVSCDGIGYMIRLCRPLSGIKIYDFIKYIEG